MSSHREAPEISKDPVADNTDVYAFVSPDQPHTVTLISNFVPLEDPPGGPNFFEFGDDVLYSIYIDNDGDGKPEIAYVFRFVTRLRNPNTFLYNTGPITSLDSPSWNKRQFYSVTRVEGPDTTAYGTAHHHSGLKAKVLARICRARPAISARGRLPSTLTWPKPPCTACTEASRCSPASGARASTSTSARSSISAICGRFRTCS